MPRNVEIKARADCLEALLARALTLADGPAQTLVQDDTFFAVPHGRLKLRLVDGAAAELIHYERPDAPGARASDYVRVAVPDAAALREALTRGLGVVGRVRKRRWLLLAGQTRIHLDRVEGLGDFVELEVVLRAGQSDADGARVAEDLMRALGLADAPRLAGAYLDLRPAERVSCAQSAQSAKTPPAPEPPAPRRSPP
jgi:adenylate cyclase class IV